jgi:ABC-type iron transport system FetAB ATPase subunit
MLGELEDYTGEVSVRGKISYVSQQAWIFPSSLKQNILFGLPYDKEKFDKVVEVCSLKRVKSQFLSKIILKNILFRFFYFFKDFELYCNTVRRRSSARKASI